MQCVLGPLGYHFLHTIPVCSIHHEIILCRKRRSSKLKQQAKSDASKGDSAAARNHKDKSKGPPRPPPPGSASKAQLETDSIEQSSDVNLESYQESGVFGQI